MAQNAKRKTSDRQRKRAIQADPGFESRSLEEQRRILAALDENESDEREPLPTDERYRRAEVAAANDHAGPELAAFRQKWRPLCGLDDLTEFDPLRAWVLKGYVEQLPSEAQAELARMAFDLAERFNCTEPQARELIVFNRPPCSSLPSVRTERRTGAQARALSQYERVREIRSKQPGVTWDAVNNSLPKDLNSSTWRRLQRDYGRTRAKLLRPEDASAAAVEAEAETARKAKVARKYDLGPLFRFGIGLPLKPR